MALRIREAEAAISAGQRRGLDLATDHLHEVADTRVPLEFGPLQATGRAEVHGDDHGTVTYGGQGLPDYAQRQHEELTWNHAPGRTAKYLEGPLHEQAAELKRLMGEGLREALR